MSCLGKSDRLAGKRADFEMRLSRWCTGYMELSCLMACLGIIDCQPAREYSDECAISLDLRIPKRCYLSQQHGNTTNDRGGSTAGDMVFRLVYPHLSDDTWSGQHGRIMQCR
jgi:hypothetical protein